MNRHEIRRVTVELDNGDLITYRGNGQILDVDTTRKVEHQGRPDVTTESLRYVTATLLVDSTFTTPVPAGVPS